MRCSRCGQNFPEDLLQCLCGCEPIQHPEQALCDPCATIEASHHEYGMLLANFDQLMDADR